MAVLFFVFFFHRQAFGSGGPLFSNATSNEIYNNSPGNVSVAVNAISGNLLVVGCGAGGDLSGTSVTDTAGNQFVLATSTFNANYHNAIAIFYAKNIKGSLSDTVTCNANLTSDTGITVLQFTSADINAPLDAVAVGQGPGTMAAVSGPFSTNNTSTSEVVIACAAAHATVPNVFTAASGYVIPNGGSNGESACEYETIGSPLANATTSIAYGSADAAPVIAVATFKASASGGSNDTTPPSVPTGLSAQVNSANQIALSWTASTDNVAVAGYLIYRNGTEVGNATGTVFVDTGLKNSTAYSYTVAAYDTSSNISGQSAPVSATTLSHNTYYISSSGGNDSWDGMEKTHTTGNTGPWAHAPGMNDATGNAAAYGPNSLPGDTFIFKGCDVWTNSSFSWTIGPQGYSNNTGYYATITTASAGLNFLGDGDKSWYNTASCPNGWNRPVFDGCKVSAPPANNLPGCTGSNVAPTGGPHPGTMIFFTPNYVTISGFEIRNHYNPPPSEGSGEAIGAPQYTSYGDVKNIYYHAWIDPTPLDTQGTIAQGSNILTITGSMNGVVVGEPIGIACLGCVLPFANNGPIVASISGNQVSLTDGYGKIVDAISNECATTPCTVIGGWDSGTFTSIQGYPNSTGMTFEDNVIDGWDTALVQNQPNCPINAQNNNTTSTYTDCLGSLTAFYQGPAIIKNNFVRYVASYYLGGFQELSGNTFENERISINPTAHSNGMEGLGDAPYAVVDNNVMLGIKPGVPLMLTPPVGSTEYVWNNVFADITSNSVIELSYPPGGGGGTAGSVDVWNNTIEGGPDPNGSIPGLFPLGPMSGCPAGYGHCDYENNYYVSCLGDPGIHDCTQSRVIIDPCGSNCTQSNNVSVPLDSANALGMDIAQAFVFSPTSGSPTIGAGANLSSYCSMVLSSGESLSSLCNDTTYGVGYDQSTHSVILPARAYISRPSSGVWDAGAYQYSSAPSATQSSPVISSPLSASATEGSYFSYQIAASNGPISYNATGLPAGLTINTSSGIISGTPTVSGTYSISIFATNSAATNSATLVLNIATAPISNPSSAPSSGGGGSGSSGGGSSGGGGGGGYYAPPTTSTSTSTASSSSASSSGTGSQLSSSTLTQSSSTASLEAELLSLTKELCSLVSQAETKGISLSSSISSLCAAPTTSFTKNLSLGDRDPEVASLQHYLNTHGYPIVTTPTYAGSLGYETEFFGPATKDALIKFQSSAGLPPTGFFGPLTRRYIGTHG